MKPVICFFENETYFYSKNYSVKTCPDDQSVTEFLHEIEKNYSTQPKIIQINFDAYATKDSHLDSHLDSQLNLQLNSKLQSQLYPSKKACVYILKDHEILSLREIQMKHTDLLRQKADFLKTVVFELQTQKIEFIEKVKKIKKWIAEGRFYQVNLTAALRSHLTMDSLQFFLTMQIHFNGNYKCHLPPAATVDHAVIGFSPELFLEKKGNLLRTAPIKGSVSVDQNTQTNLLDSQKEDAELSMIVDLLRNDFNSLEIKSSAQVTNHRQLMNLNYIHHTYSEIQITTEKTLPFILERVMPGGSISGCPKQESLLAIQELETHQRQAYTGTIGWWYKNDFKLNVTIRTFVQSEDFYFYYAGCGIVYDSDPEKEFAELIDKAGILNVQYT